jgi:hypothetical protein
MSYIYSNLVIPAHAELAPHLMRGIQLHIFMVPCFRRDGVWIRAPRLRGHKFTPAKAGAGMTKRWRFVM